MCSASLAHNRAFIIKPHACKDKHAMRTRTRNVLLKIRAKGAGWLCRRILKEIRTPGTPLGIRFRPLNRGAFEVVRRFAPQGQPLNDLIASDALVVFYDLDVSPITYDFLWALVIGELRRIELNLTTVHVVFVPGRDDGLREEIPEYEKVVDAESRRWRLHHILYPICSLLASCTAITLSPTRRHAALIRAACPGRFYPADYHTVFPTAHKPNDGLIRLRNGASPGVLSAPVQALRYIDQWLACRAQGRRVVCITLRAYEFNAARNSNLRAWLEFARSLDKKRYLPILIPDTNDALRTQPELEGVTAFPIAAIDVHLRAALYQRSWLNMGVSGGPMALCWFLHNCRYALFNLRVPGVDVASDEYFRTQGYEVGAGLPNASLSQRWIWEPDDLPVLRRVFTEIEDQIG